MDTATIRQGELMGKGIMAYETTEEVGRVAHLLVEMKAAKVVGLVYKAPGLDGAKAGFGLGSAGENWGRSHHYPN